MMKRLAASAAMTTVLLSSSLLGGCAVGTVGEADRVSQASARDATKLMEEARQPLPAARISKVQVVNDVFTTGTARRSDHGEPLPRIWERPGSFVIKSGPLLHLFDIGTQITDITTIPVDFAPDVATLIDGNGTGGASVASAPVGGKPTGAQGGDVNAMLRSMGIGAGASSFGSGNTAGAQGDFIHPLVGTRSTMKVDFSGRLSQFLDELGAHFNVSWEFSGGEIRIFRNVTRTYTLHALPSSIDLTSSLNADSSTDVGNGGSGGGNTGGSNQKVNSAVSVAIWKDVGSAVNGIVGSYGQVSMAVSTGTITVTAPPEIISRVQSYLDGQNARLNKEVTVSVQVLNVDLQDADNYSLDLQTVFSQASKYGVQFASPTGAAVNGVGSLSYGLASGNGKFGGSKAVIDAMSTMGRVTVRTTASVTTLNGVPAPLQIANTRGYVHDEQVSDSTTTSSSNNGGTTRTQLDVSSVTTGFSLSLLPRINADGTGMLMQFGINISELNGADNGFDNFTTPDGSETVQLPNINSRNFVQQAYVPDGSTLVLAGFEQNGNTGNKAGVGKAGFMGLGGYQNGKAERSLVVIMLSPSILDTSTPLITSD